jgi:hypothetical protein
MRTNTLLIAIAVATACAHGCSSIGASSAFSEVDAGTVTESGGPAIVDANSCQPGEVETYTPSVYRPATAQWQGVCTSDQIATFGSACLALGGPSSPDACAAFAAPDAATAPCAACILTPDSSSTYGPLIAHDHGTFITPNVAGCIELTAPGQLSCAKAEAALLGCQLAACEANCPVHDTVTRSAYDACALAADTSGCQPYSTMAACVSSLDAAAASVCSGSFMDFYNAVVPLFCGPPLLDASATALDGAVSDGLSPSDGSANAGHDAQGMDASGPLGDSAPQESGGPD